MTISGMSVKKFTRSPGSQSQNGHQIHSRKKHARSGDWWHGEGDDDADGDALRRHLLPGLDLPVPSASCVHSDSEGDAHCLSTLHANDFLPSVLDDKREEVREGLDQPCTKSDLKGAISTLIALNRAQSERIQTLNHQFAVWHRELTWKINNLESTLRLHDSILFSIIDNLQNGHPDSANWCSLKAILSRRGGDRDARYVDSSDSSARNQEVSWEANDVLSDAPANWTSKLFDWSIRVDCLPVAEVGVRESPRATAFKGSGSSSVETEAAAEPPPNAASDSDEVPWCGYQGLRVHVMGSGGSSLSPAADRDAQRFRDFIGNASLRQEAWMETFSSFAVTAAPVAALLQAESLKLQLLDESVTLPDTDLLLLVAESLEPLGGPPLKVGLRVLCLLERTVAARCNVKSNSLRKGALVDLLEFEPFCVCVQPKGADSESSSNNSKFQRKVLSIPVCSLQRIKLVRGASSHEEGSASGSDSSSAQGNMDSQGLPNRVNGNKTVGSSTSSGSRSCQGGRHGHASTDSNEPTGSATDSGEPHSVKATRKRRASEGEAESEERSEDQIQVGPQGQDASAKPQARAESRQQQRPADHQEHSTTQAETRPLTSCSRKHLGDQGHASDGTVTEKLVPSKTHSGDDTHPAKTACTLEGCAKIAQTTLQHAGARQARTAANKSGSEGSVTSCKTFRVKDSCPHADDHWKRTANAAPSAETCQRTGTATSIRCSGQAAQQDLERMRQQLPRVRAVLPRQMRQQLPAFDCSECSAFFGMVERCQSLSGSCGHGHRRATVGEEGIEIGGRQASAGGFGQQRMFSRHRHFAPPPSTPPGFWDLGM